MWDILCSHRFAFLFISFLFTFSHTREQHTYEISLIPFLLSFFFSSHLLSSLPYSLLSFLFSFLFFSYSFLSSFIHLFSLIFFLLFFLSSLPFAFILSPLHLPCHISLFFWYHQYHWYHQYYHTQTFVLFAILYYYKLL